MTFWGWALFLFLSLAGFALLLLALFHVRIRAAWSGSLGQKWKQEGSFRVEYGFPGFMHAWDLDPVGEEDVGSPESGVGSEENASPNVAVTTSSTSNSPPRPVAPLPTPDSGLPTSPADRAEPPGAAAPAKKPRKNRDRHRWRRALFHLATDAPAWKLFMQYDLATLRRMVRMLNLHVAMDAGHPDPVLLGKVAGYWHALAPLRPRGVTLGLRFQDRDPSFAVRAEGGFSVLSLLGFSVQTVLTFPWFGLGRRAHHAWKGHALNGWRGAIYRKIQTLG